MVQREVLGAHPDPASRAIPSPAPARSDGASGSGSRRRTASSTRPSRPASSGCRAESLHRLVSGRNCQDDQLDVAVAQAGEHGEEVEQDAHPPAPARAARPSGHQLPVAIAVTNMTVAIAAIMGTRIRFGMRCSCRDRGPPRRRAPVRATRPAPWRSRFTSKRDSTGAGSYPRRWSSTRGTVTRHVRSTVARSVHYPV